jgi:hypothetical protein
MSGAAAGEELAPGQHQIRDCRAGDSRNRAGLIRTREQPVVRICLHSRIGKRHTEAPGPGDVLCPV